MAARATAKTLYHWRFRSIGDLGTIPFAPFGLHIIFNRSPVHAAPSGAVADRDRLPACPNSRSPNAYEERRALLTLCFP